MDNQNEATIISILKVAEGGIGQSHALFLLQEAGIPAKPATSIYVGHTAVTVPEKQERKAMRILFGSR